MATCGAMAYSHSRTSRRSVSCSRLSASPSARGSTRRVSLTEPLQAAAVVDELQPTNQPDHRQIGPLFGAGRDQRAVDDGDLVDAATPHRRQQRTEAGEELPVAHQPAGHHRRQHSPGRRTQRSAAGQPQRHHRLPPHRIHPGPDEGIEDPARLPPRRLHIDRYATGIAHPYNIVVAG